MGCFPNRNVSKDDPGNIEDEVSIRFINPKTSISNSKIRTVSDFIVNIPKLLIQPKKNSFHKYQISSETYGFGHFGLHSILRRGVQNDSQVSILVEIIKISELDEKATELLSNFFEILELIKTLDHPYLLKVIDVYENKDELFLVYEEFLGVDLYDKICDLGSFTEKNAGLILRQILSLVHYIHQNGLRFNKLSAEAFHVCFHKGSYHIKFMDLPSIIPFPKIGLQRIEKKRHIFSRDFYSAPEFLLHDVISEKNESFSLGVLFYLMLKGSFPFNQDEEIEENSELCSLNLQELQDEMSSEAIDLLNSLLKIESDQRISISNALQSIFFKNFQSFANFSTLVESLKPNLNLLNKPLSKFCRMLLMRFFVTSDEKKKMYDIFNELDEDYDGFLEGNFFFDSDGHKKLGFEEFSMMNITKFSIDEIKAKEIIFKEITKGKEYLNAEIFWGFLGKNIVEKSVIEEIFDEYKNKISFEEFQNIF